MKTFLSFSACLLLVVIGSVSVAQSKILWRIADPACPAIGYTELIQDDATGTLFLHNRAGNEADYWEVYSGPLPCKTVVLPLKIIGVRIVNHGVPLAQTVANSYIVDNNLDTFRFRSSAEVTEVKQLKDYLALENFKNSRGRIYLGTGLVRPGSHQVVGVAGVVDVKNPTVFTQNKPIDLFIEQKIIDASQGRNPETDDSQIR